MKELMEEITRLGELLVCLIDFLRPLQNPLFQGCVQLNQSALRPLEACDLHKCKDYSIDPILRRAEGAHAEQEPATSFALYFALNGHQGAQNFLSIFEKLTVLEAMSEMFDRPSAITGMMLKSSRMPGV